MRRNLAEPGDAGVAEGGAGVEAAGDGAGDERPPLLRQQPQHALLRRHQPIQPRRLPVQVVGDGALLWREAELATANRMPMSARSMPGTADFAALQMKSAEQAAPACSARNRHRLPCKSML